MFIVRGRTLLPGLMFLAFGMQMVFCQPRVSAPVDASGFTTITSYDSLQTFLGRFAVIPGMQVERIALTRQERSVSVVRISSSPVFGSDTSKVRVLLFAQQHGDEPSGKEALTMLLADIASGGLRDILAGVDLLIVPQMNPDGAELRQRLTTDTLDLNRSHAILSSPETRGLHELFYRWMPHVTLDIHQFGSFSSSWSDSGFIKTVDVQFGMLTNLNTAPAVRELQHSEIFPFIAERMKHGGYSFHEYLVGSPGDRLRHSTTEPNDGRQSFGILGTISFIQEGRKWRTAEEELKRCVLSQRESIEALLRYCAAHAGDIRGIVDLERRSLLTRAGTAVALRMERRPGGGRMDIPVRMVDPPRDTTWQVHPYHDEVHLLTETTLPLLYLIPREDTSVIALLHRHHISIDTVKAMKRMRASTGTIESIGWQVLEEDSLPRAFVSWKAGEVTLSPGDFMVSTSQLQSLLLGILLEPESMWGLTKYDQFSFLLKQRQYPIFRIP